MGECYDEYFQFEKRQKTRKFLSLELSEQS